jgi:nucleoside-diphosphate-sugar epimerase
MIEESTVHSQLNSYRGIRAAVLGASGFIGRWVARTLSSRGAKLYLLVRDESAAEKVFSQYGIRGSVSELDLADGAEVKRVLKKIRPSITFNLAGYGVDPSERDEQTSYQINAHLVETAGKAVVEIRDSNWPGQSMVHVGTALEYGIISGDLNEESSPHPTTVYGKSKLAGTKAFAALCRNHQMKGLTARLFTVYGPGEHPGRLLPSLLHTARNGIPLDLTSGNQKRDFTYVEDISEGLLRLGLVKTLPEPIVNLATGRLTSVRSFAQIAAKILRIPSDSLKFGILPNRDSEMEHSEVRIDRMLQLTGWIPPTDIKTGILKTLSFENLQPFSEE